MAVKKSKKKPIPSNSAGAVTLKRRSLKPTDPSAFRTGTTEIDNVIRDKDLSLEEVNALKESIQTFAKAHRLRAAFVCRGEKCISQYICPFLKIERKDLCPVGKRCPIDMIMATELYGRYESELTKDGTVIDVFTETYMQELVAIELYLARIHDKLANRDETGENPLMGTRVSNINNRTGETYWENIEHPLVATRYNLLDRKDRILKALLLTPEARARYKADKAKSLADQMREIQKLAAMNLDEMKKKGTINLEEIKKRATLTMETTSERHDL